MMALMLRNATYLFDVCFLAFCLIALRALTKSGVGTPQKLLAARAQCPRANLLRICCPAQFLRGKWRSKRKARAIASADATSGTRIASSLA